MIIFKIIEDPHYILDQSFKRLKINGHKPFLIKSITSVIYTEIKILRQLLVSIDNLYFIIRIILSKKNYLIIREFSNSFLGLFQLLPYSLKKRLILNINHNLKDSSISLPQQISSAMEAGLCFLLFDGYEVKNLLPLHLRRMLLTPRFPSLFCNGHIIKNAKSKITIGVVSDFSSEKINQETFSNFIKNFNNFNDIELAMGLRQTTTVTNETFNQLKFYSTKTRNDFINFLKKIDFIIIFANKKKYYLRHSGTIMDAINYGVIPIVPNYPVFRSQVLNPIQVGLLYNNIDEIALLINNITIIEYQTNMNEYLIARYKCDYKNE